MVQPQGSRQPYFQQQQAAIHSKQGLINPLYTICLAPNSKVKPDIFFLGSGLSKVSRVEIEHWTSYKHF